jgi:hypothetical protein
MKLTTETLNKKIYSSPNIELFKLDNEISLQLQSNAPAGPGEGVMLIAPDHFNNDPFKNTMA